MTHGRGAVCRLGVRAIQASHCQTLFLVYGLTTGSRPIRLQACDDDL